MKEYKNAASTASLIVVFKNSICLIKRKHEPFKGSWALPGGFLNCDQETLEEAAIRELKEETNLQARDIQFFCVNSEPDRDPRGHVIDHVFIVKSYTGEPEANDDASELKFFNLRDLPFLAFDHQKVIEKYLLIDCNHSKQNAITAWENHAKLHLKMHGLGCDISKDEFCKYWFIMGHNAATTAVPADIK